jgi:hypothetical protein
MSARDLPGGKRRRRVRLTSPPSASCLENCGSLDVSELYVPLWPVTGIASHTRKGETKKKQGNKDTERIKKSKIREGRLDKLMSTDISIYGKS